MTRDIKLNQDKGYFDLDFKDGDFELINSLETAVYMSVLGYKRAEQSEVSNSIFRKGHYLNQFNDVAGYQIGGKLWLYTEQERNIEDNIELVNDSIKDSLKWLLDDNICKEININTKSAKETLDVDIELKIGGQAETEYYNLFINL